MSDKQGTVSPSPAEILDKAVTQADEAGWKGWRAWYPAFPIDSWSKEKQAKFNYTRRFEIIYDHAFAKAFWKVENRHEENVCMFCGNPDCGRGEFCGAKFDGKGGRYRLYWQFHLQQQVISDDPIAYLARGIKDKTPSLKDN